MGANFTGWATKVGLKCSDGRTIMPDAFKHMDGQRVPLVYMHGHKDINNLLGYVELQHKDEGVYCEAFFNETPHGQAARLAVEHGDLDSLSIYANKLVEKTKQVFHGNIREVSLVLSGANPGAKIDNVVIAHGDDVFDELEDEAIITTGLTLEHVEVSAEEVEEESNEEQELAHATVREVYESMSDEQKQVLHYMVGAAVDAAAGELEQSGTDNDNEGDLTHQEGNGMTRNVFDKGAAEGADGVTNTLTHDQMKTIWEDTKKPGMTFKTAFLAHADEYGVTNIEELFPEAKNLNTKPEWITRRMEWVEKVLGPARKLPYARFKSATADLTHEEARAKGYIKGDLKKEQFFAIKSRSTGPKTIYKKQKLDRDDIVDITDFNIVEWFWVEMYFMLREEIARAVLIGDGREVEDPDKIDEDKIRPIAKDDEFYTDRLVLTGTLGQDTVDQILLGRETYEGTSPTLYCTQTNWTKLLLTRDGENKRLWKSKAELLAELEVDDVVFVPVMKDYTIEGDELFGVLVNMGDYSIGTDQGGEITKFDQFDIDYNQYKYLIEGRMSGALTKPKTAQVLLLEGTVTETVLTPDAPTFVEGTGVVTIPTQTGVVYKNGQTGATLASGAQTALDPGATLKVRAEAADEDYAIDIDVQKNWTFTRPAA